MRKAILLFMVVVATLIVGTSEDVLAGPCSPPGGYDWCYEWFNNYQGANAHSKIWGTYERFDDIDQSGRYVVGDIYMNLGWLGDQSWVFKHSGDPNSQGFIPNWDWFEFNSACNENG